MNERRKIDWFITLVPFACVVLLAVFFLLNPSLTQVILGNLRFIVGDRLGVLFLMLGLGCFLTTMYIAFSKVGTIRLGKGEKPQYSNFTWGSMIFTSTMAADILFYSLIEWSLYGGEKLVQKQGLLSWGLTYSLFHWGPIAWSFYLVLAVAFGYMLHIRGVTKQRFSEACRGLLGDRVDGPLGTLINFVAIFALICGTATTFSLTTPLIGDIISHLSGVPSSAVLSVLVLFGIALLYTTNVLFGLKGVTRAAKYCTYLFIALLLYFLIGGGQIRFTLENGFSSLGMLGQHFIQLATTTDPMRLNHFPQKWTIYYWAYWMVWAVATPFFIAKISKGRTLKNLILGGYGWGLAGTFSSFIIMGSYGMYLQLTHRLDIIGFIANGGAYSEAILKIFHTLPMSQIGLVLLAITMVAFYIAVFDSITMVVSSYSYREIEVDQEPDKKIRVIWAIIFIVLPVALIFNGEGLANLQTISIIAALPMGVIIVMVVWSFFKDVGRYEQFN
ncbi:BCCT family transporter [Lacticaseibacillus sp. N501-2]|uniref:BCCT family transporter n=1 Tax=Lacticaseibacillus salsurae TaxID=3367729 RepID=UPI0038B40FF3